MMTKNLQLIQSLGCHLSPFVDKPFPISHARHFCRALSTFLKDQKNEL